MPYRYLGIWIKQHLEYPAGVFGAIGAGIGAAQLTTVAIATTASIIGGTLMVIITHFLKRYLLNKFPITK